MEKDYLINYPMIKKEKNKYLILAYQKDEYLKAKRFAGICNLSHYDKILVSGENALELVNFYSVTNLLKKEENSYMSIFFKRKKFLGEGQIIKISEHRFIILMKNSKKLLNALINKRKDFSYTIIHNATNDYSFFSFHGDYTYTFFEKINDKHLYKINHQGYIYYTMLTFKKDEKNIIVHFTNQSFILLGLINYKTFLHSNNVIDNLSKINKKKLYILLPTIYEFNNTNMKLKKHKLIIERYEVQGNFLLDKNYKIYNNQRKIIGFVHDSYYIPFKSNPFIIALLYPDKLSKIALLKAKKKEIIIKKVFSDETQ